MVATLDPRGQINGGEFVEQDLFGQLVSPEVHADGRVTLRFSAPNAQAVLAHGLAGVAVTPLKQNARGVWEVTVGPLPPDLYSYSFSIDGATVTDPHNRCVKKWLTVENQVDVLGDPPRLHQRRPVPHGVVHHHTYASRTTGSDRGVFVYTPPAYRAAGTDRYPLLVLMHGYGDDESAWWEVGRAHWIADNLIAEGLTLPLVIAMPYGHPLPLARSGTFDEYATPNTTALAQDLFTDLLPLLNDHYRLKDDRSQRAITGLSMGGGQALTIGLQHLDQFAWIGGFSSAAPCDDLEATFPEFVSNPSAVNARVNLLWIACGQEDFLLGRNQAFVAWLQSRGIAHQFVLSAGGHDWTVWRKYLADFLPQLFR